MRSFSPAEIFSPIGLDVRWQVVNAVVEAGNGDGAVRPVHGSKNVGKNVDRIAGGTAEQSGMQVAVGAG
jgi:hypothetical protein